jgi:hypothetical protein
MLRKRNCIRGGGKIHAERGIADTGGVSMIIEYLKEWGQGVKTRSIYVREGFNRFIGVESKTIELIEFISTPDIIGELGKVLRRQRVT